MTILTVARNAFRENIRDKILYNLILFAILMILSSLALGQLTLGHEDKVIIDLGLTCISVFGTLIAIFIGIGLVYKEMEKRTVYALLPKPIHRWEFILGKYLGLLFTLFVNVSIMTVGLWVTIACQGVGLHGCLRLLPAVYTIYLSLALTTALALVFSTFSTPALSALFTFFLWVIGHFNSDLVEFGRLAKSAPLEKAANVLYYVLPNISNFTILNSRNILQIAAYSLPIDAVSIAWATAYAFLYSLVLLLIAITIFARRDFK